VGGRLRGARFGPGGRAPARRARDHRVECQRSGDPGRQTDRARDRYRVRARPFRTSPEPFLRGRGAAAFRRRNHGRLGVARASDPRTLLPALTYTRILAVPAVMALILAGPDHDSAYTAAAIVFAVAASTDFADGYLARRWAVTTKLGSFL